MPWETQKTPPKRLSGSGGVKPSERTHGYAAFPSRADAARSPPIRADGTAVNSGQIVICILGLARIARTPCPRDGELATPEAAESQRGDGNLRLISDPRGARNTKEKGAGSFRCRRPHPCGTRCPWSPWRPCRQSIRLALQQSRDCGHRAATRRNGRGTRA